MKYVVGLGSNVGDRLSHLQHAVIQLRGFCTVLKVSRVLETAPVGPVAQEDFLNAAALIVSGLQPEALLAQLLTIERERGRTRDVRWGPRTIDLDILWAEQPYSSAELQIPHPRMHERAFAKIPLADVLGEAVDIPSDAAVRVFPESLV